LAAATASHLTLSFFTFSLYSKESAISMSRETMPTVRSRDLGHELQTLMQATGMSGHDIARRIDVYASLLSHAINGKRCITEADLVAILVVCHVDHHERDRIIKLSHDVTHHGWLQHHDPATTTWSRTLIRHERAASRIVDLQTLTLPPLLQTDDYARTTLARRVTNDKHAIESILTAQRERQMIFAKYPPPKMLFFMPEAALHAPAGDAATMSDQMQHLLVNAALPHVEIRVIPRTAGIHAGYTGSFTLLEFDAFAPVVHLGGLSFEVFLEQPHQIDDHRRLITYLDAIALSTEESMTVISSADTDLHSGSHHENER
jgi:hypothetical protein